MSREESRLWGEARAASAAAMQARVAYFALAPTDQGMRAAYHEWQRLADVQQKAWDAYIRFVLNQKEKQ